MLSVVLPVFNEADKLEKNVSCIRKYLDSSGMDYEIIIAEDGSTDGSDEIAARIARPGKIIHMHHEERLGRGGALKRAGMIARGDFIIYMDTDLAVDIRHIKDVLRHLQDNDVVTGSRYLNDSDTKRSFHRLVLSRIYHLTARSVFPCLGLTDTECGFKGFRKEVFLSVNMSVRNNGWSWDIEFLVRAKKGGFRIKEIPVAWKEGETTKVSIIRDGLSQLIEIFRIRSGF
jgi:glycosyltransferase involved in cell wall biosynthesis